MRAFVYVALKKTVLDPQGKTIQAALAKLGHQTIRDVRQGKCFEIELEGVDRERARGEVEQIARSVLTNPVIEEYSVRLEE
jgi:phosphoribosylformylglycinamidine synthase